MNPVKGDALSVDYLRYYDLEAYVFKEVAERFQTQGWLDAFDFFSIVIWKANRAKSRVARNLRRRGEKLDDVCRRLTTEIHDASTHEARLTLLVANWGFRLPMASAILTVLYPEEFTVYDTRTCGELGAFSELANLTNPAALWAGYEAFVKKVRAASSEPKLRDKDRFLMGRSIAEQLKRDIQRWSEEEPVNQMEDRGS